jgi:hypothetical protein
MDDLDQVHIPHHGLDPLTRPIQASETAGGPGSSQGGEGTNLLLPPTFRFGAESFVNLQAAYPPWIRVRKSQLFGSGIGRAEWQFPVPKRFFCQREHY